MTYAEHVRRMWEAATRWEAAAESARQKRDMSLAYDCSQHAIRCWYLAAAQPHLEAIFNAQGESDATGT